MVNELIAPLRFACIDPQIYRGSYPNPINTTFMESLGLRTIISVTPEALDIDIKGAERIHIHSAASSGKSKKKREVPITLEIVEQALEVLEDPLARPIYIHCMNGSQVTALITACYRRRQQWSMTSTLQEFERHSDYDRKDIQFIADFSEGQCYFPNTEV